MQNYKCIHIRTLSIGILLLKITVFDRNYVPIAVKKSLSTCSNFSKETVVGRGSIHKKHWQSPFSTFDWLSMRFLATLGCVKPPIVNPVCFMAKFASPETVQVYNNKYIHMIVM